MTKLHADYSDRTRIRLTKLAREIFKSEGFNAIAHIHPRAYCVAKGRGGQDAIFVHPPCDSTLPLDITTIWHAENVLVGQWYAIAYVNTNRGGFPRILEGPL